LRTPWLTTGPQIPKFEKALAEQVGAREAVALNSGTAALHAAMHVLDIGPGDEVIVPALTFAASANCVLYQQGMPVFADVDPNTLLIDLAHVARLLTPRTRAILAVDYAGQPCDYQALGGLAQRHGLAVVADACHALGANDRGRPVGSLADLTVFSFHPVKHITTGEGGAVTTDDPALAQRLRAFRNHGITTDHHERDKQGSWYYEMVELGYNYRLTDFQAALGLSQLGKLSRFVERRQALAAAYDRALASRPMWQPVQTRPGVCHAYHLYVVRLTEELRDRRREIFTGLRALGMGVNVHYIPVYLHPYYQRRFPEAKGSCPVAEDTYERILTLPLFPAMTDEDVERVVTALDHVLARA
jgi:perosamine synthetase